MSRILLVLTLSLVFQNPAFCQKINTKKLDSLFEALDSRDLAMGSVTISKNGVVQYQKAIGYAYISPDKKIRTDIHTQYRIGSVTKMFTAVMIFQLIEEGKIKGEDKLEKYFPTLPNASKISIDNLLNHRSGLHNYTEDTHFTDWMNETKTQTEMLQLISKKGADFTPGSKAAYCNTNYLLLGYIIQKIDRTTYQQALQRRIISKAQLQEAQYAGAIDVRQNQSASYKYGEGRWKPEKETNPDIHQGAGALSATPTAIVKFIEALFAGKLVSKSSLGRMKTLVDGYGMGMFPFPFNNRQGYGHGGRIEEFYTALQYYPADQLTIAYCTNGINYPRSDIMDGILKISFNEPYEIPFSRLLKYNNQFLDKYLGTYMSDQMPLEVTCTKDDTQLLFETRGQTFRVEPVTDNYFMHRPTGTFFVFSPEKRELLIKETDNVYYLKKKN